MNNPPQGISFIEVPLKKKKEDEEEDPVHEWRLSEEIRHVQRPTRSQQLWSGPSDLKTHD